MDLSSPSPSPGGFPSVQRGDLDRRIVGPTGEPVPDQRENEAEQRPYPSVIFLFIFGFRRFSAKVSAMLE